MDHSPDGKNTQATTGNSLDIFLTTSSLENQFPGNTHRNGEVAWQKTNAKPQFRPWKTLSGTTARTDAEIQLTS